LQPAAAAHADFGDVFKRGVGAGVGIFFVEVGVGSVVHGISVGGLMTTPSWNLNVSSPSQKCEFLKTAETVSAGRGYHAFVMLAVKKYFHSFKLVSLNCL
jgi:hypothetical protein